MSPKDPFHLNLGHNVRAHSTSGALGIFLPTHATLVHAHPSINDLGWTSRAHRKRRYRNLRFDGTDEPETALKALARFGKLEWRELSWWVAVLFTFGSIVWVINGFIVFLPQINSEKYGQNEVGGGWTAWLGATIFEFGAVTALLEAMNREEDIAFGTTSSHEDERPLQESSPHLEPRKKTKRLRLIPSDPKLWFEIGFWANFVQIWAATIFWISGWTGIPQVFESIQRRPRLEDGVYWTPQVIGGSGFVIASYVLAIHSSQLTIFWNLVGAVGFTLCGIFGYSRFIPADGSSNWATYQSACSTFWGGWAFLVGSIVQWWEAVQPPRPQKNKPTDVEAGSNGQREQGVEEKSRS
ncbi:hypothetical protein PIIN_06460 [Serendipita indica DSM 11827]|uniref:Integral membrane protein n=1 Tax=Serendipita indica (strain DSM 11827) TaxID=1109443 RepID=G4TMI0_SERID|nr:hypothetical protein PIIN_06460 [Serendipita indica DSM 11827]